MEAHLGELPALISTLVATPPSTGHQVNTQPVTDDKGSDGWFLLGQAGCTTSMGRQQQVVA